MAAQTSGLVNLVFSRQTGFFKPEHPFIDKPIIITEPAVQSAWLLGLGSRLYPSNMQRVLNKDLTQFRQSLSRVRQNLESERKALLAGLSVVRRFGDFIYSCRNSYKQNSHLAFGHVLDTKNGHRDSNYKIQEEKRPWRAKERQDQWQLPATRLLPWQNLNDVYFFLKVLYIPVGQFGEVIQYAV